MASSRLSVILHGHFYQPPRDDPWFETVEPQPSAQPFRDWNERVTKECYRAVVAARRLGPDGRISRIVNTLERMSFDFGPTLLGWMEREAIGPYEAILEADAVSCRANGGLGNAMAQAYHHTILPLASRREKVTEVRWGVEDFRRRFRRDPLGLWLPETAVDDETLDVLAQEGIRFTVLAPHQIKEVPPHGLPGLYRTKGGRSIVVFPYHGPLSHDVAFGSLLKDSVAWAQAILGAAPPPEPFGAPGGGSPDWPDQPPGLVSIATDGETYGHHHRFGEMALAAVLDVLARDPRVRLENFSSYLARVTPEHNVELVEPSSWSCVHGVERWRSNCGCRMDPDTDTQQEWRRGLRDAMDWLADRIHEVFEEEGAPLLGNVWAARDRYGAQEGFLQEDRRARELLELEKHALRLFTSCGWFFDDLAGIEPRQILKYAARALELVGPRQGELEEGFLARLDQALSNERPPRSGKTIFLQDAKPHKPPHFAVAAGEALWEAAVSALGSRQDGSEEAGQGLRPPEGSTAPGVPGYESLRLPPHRFLVTHRRTGRQWELATRVLRPSETGSAVSVWAVGSEGEPWSFSMDDLPEWYRGSITEKLLDRVPDPAEALIADVRRLRDWAYTADPLLDTEAALEEAVNGAQRGADLLLLLDRPIPFDAQTIFADALRRASEPARSRLTVLRMPLGFTQDS